MFPGVFHSMRFRFGADRDDPFRSALDRDNRRLIDDDTLSTNVNKLLQVPRSIPISAERFLKNPIENFLRLP
jgi:hypothetical protein